MPHRIHPTTSSTAQSVIYRDFKVFNRDLDLSKRSRRSHVESSGSNFRWRQEEIIVAPLPPIRWNRAEQKFPERTNRPPALSVTNVAEFRLPLPLLFFDWHGFVLTTILNGPRTSLPATRRQWLDSLEAAPFQGQSKHSDEALVGQNSFFISLLFPCRCTDGVTITEQR